MKKNTQYINITPHVINLNDGRTFPASGMTARVSEIYGDIIDDIATVKPGPLVLLKEGKEIPFPQEQSDIRYIVSGVVYDAKGERKDFVKPATSHADAIRENGQIRSVPCFSVKAV